MKTLVLNDGSIVGTYPEITVGETALNCNGIVMQLSVLGGGFQILEGSPPIGHDRYINGQFVPRALTVVERAAMAKQIDDAVTAVYAKPMTLSKEYEGRENHAQSFKNSNYNGQVPARVSGFATAAGLTSQAATDLILAQATQLRAALDQLSDLRMKKYYVARADVSDADATAAFNTTIASIKAIAAALA